jgi:hypothetical protein
VCRNCKFYSSKFSRYRTVCGTLFYLELICVTCYFWRTCFFLYLGGVNEAHDGPYRLWSQLFIIVRIIGNYNSNICNNANFNWKSLKSQKMQVTIIFNYSSLPGQGFKPTTLRSMNFKFVLNGSPKIMNFVKNELSKLALPILFNDLFISFAFVCTGQLH